MNHSLAIILIIDVVLLGLFHSWSSNGLVVANGTTNTNSNLSAGSVKKYLTSNECNDTFVDYQGTIVLTLDNGQIACDAYISGPNGSVVEMTISAPNAANITFQINDQWYEADNDAIYIYTGGDIKPQTIYSFSPQVLLTLEGDEPFQIEISYVIQEKDNLTTSLTNSSGIIDTNGNSDDFINFQHTWFISAGEDNFIYFFLQNITLDDSAGDFLAIGTGSEVFADSPALMISGKWMDYPTIHLNGTEAYVTLFMKTYSPNLGVTLYYDSWLYTPPTLFPRPTEPPTIILSATFNFDDEKDDYRDVVSNFTQAFTTTAIKYCNRETIDNDKLPHYDLVLDVVVAEVVENKPCLVVEFYVDILNGTCLKDISFSEDDYKWLMGNYSKDLNKDFGREVMSDCPMYLLWILAVVLVAVVALLIVIFVGFKSVEINFKGMNAVPTEEVQEEQEQEQEQENTYDYQFTMSQTSPTALPAVENVYQDGMPNTQENDVDSIKNGGIYFQGSINNNFQADRQLPFRPIHYAGLPNEPAPENRKSVGFQELEMKMFTGSAHEAYPYRDEGKDTFQDTSLMKAWDAEGADHDNYGYVTDEADQGSQSTERSSDKGIYDCGHASTSSRNDDDVEYRNDVPVRGTGFVNKGFVINEDLQPLPTPESSRDSVYEIVHQRSSSIYEIPTQKDDTSSDNSH